MTLKNYNRRLIAILVKTVVKAVVCIVTLGSLVLVGTLIARMSGLGRGVKERATDVVLADWINFWHTVATEAQANIAPYGAWVGVACFVLLAWFLATLQWLAITEREDEGYENDGPEQADPAENKPTATTPTTKIRCSECGWTGPADDRLIAVNPWREAEMIEGCPVCREPVEFQRLCDEPGCTQDATCGTPSPEGYRRCCGEHYQATQEKR